MKSYHMNALYAPIGFTSWETIAMEFLEIKHRGFPPLEFQVWINTVLGEAFEDRGERPKLEALLTRNRTYKKGFLPEEAEPYFLTLGADIQKDRIECEIVAWGHDKISWSINYLIIPGDTADIYNECWTALASIIKAEYMGKKILLSGIDSGFRTQIVYEYCAGMGSQVFPVMGSETLMKGREHIKFFDVSGLAIQRLNVNTDLLKQEIYQDLAKGNYEDGRSPEGYCHFPMDYTRDHYNRLTAESRVLKTTAAGKKYIWDAGSRRNEQLDCFDEQTEVLTSSGWKFFKDLNRREKLATVNLESENIEFQKPVAYIEKDHSGEMIQIKGRRLDILVTPNHRMVTVKKRQEVISRKPYKRKWNLDPRPEITLAKDLTIHHQLLMAANFVVDEEETYNIPAYISKKGIEIWPEVDVNKKVFASFMGWMVSEGCTFKHESKTQKKSIRHRVQLFQNEGQNSEKIRGILKHLPWKFSERNENGNIRFTITSVQLYLEAVKCGIGVENKKVPRWIKESDHKTIKSFLSSAIDGDGWIQKTGNQEPFRMYATISKQLADDMQELFVKSGKTASIVERNNLFVYRDGAINVAKENLFTVGKKQYWISEGNLRKASLDGGGKGKRECIAKKTEYIGKVYCATVPNGTLICRRGGKTFIAGNCRVYNLALVYAYKQ
ncbi:MAG: phage terminase large subunit family protein, partial [Bacteroidales bacterium]|nr:phage terminase large subunit family protein [Bacteroidales bacterium]